MTCQLSADEKRAAEHLLLKGTDEYESDYI
jgi:hypothetical protein